MLIQRTARVSHLHFAFLTVAIFVLALTSQYLCLATTLSHSDSSSYSVHWIFAEEASKQTGGVLQVVQTTDAEVERPTVQPSSPRS